MENKNFKSFRYVVGNDFTYDDKVVVKVFFIYKYKNAVRAVDVKKKRGADDSYYIAEAKKVINQEINNGKLAKFAKKYSSPSSKKLKLALAVVLSAAIIGPGSFYTWKHFDTINQQEAAIRHVISLIRNLNPNSTEAEINAATKSFEDLPENLKNIVPEDDIEYLGKQKSLFELDKAEAKKIDDLTIELSIPSTTEIQLQRVEERLNKLTPRAHTLLREGTDKLIQDVKDAIEIDKEKAKKINDNVEKLNVDTATVEDVLKIIESTIALSNRAFSYITEESIQKVTYLIEYWEIASEVLDLLMPYVNEYSTEGTVCTIDDINLLENVYEKYFTTSVKQLADGDPYYFSDKIETAKGMWETDLKCATKLADLAKALDPKTCLDEDIKKVTDEYEKLAVNQRIKNLADERGYSFNLQIAIDALDADKAITKEFYEKEALILNDMCTQDDINNVKTDYDNYYSAATVRLQKLITRPPYDLKTLIADAQKSYDDDYKNAVDFYNSQLKKLTKDSPVGDITDVQSDFNKYKASEKPRRVRFLASGGEHDLQARIDEAMELYNKDFLAANDFDAAIRGLPSDLSSFTIEEKMVLVSSNFYLNGYDDAKKVHHDFITNRARNLVNAELKEKCLSFNAKIADKFKLTKMPVCENNYREEFNPFSSDNVIRFDPEVGLYVPFTFVESAILGLNNLVFSLAMGNDWWAVFANQYNHVSSRVYVPKNAACSNYVYEFYVGGSTHSDSVFQTISKDGWTTFDVNYNDEMKTKNYNGVELMFDKLDKSNYGLEFKVTAQYSEIR